MNNTICPTALDLCSRAEGLPPIFGREGKPWTAAGRVRETSAKDHTDHHEYPALRILEAFLLSLEGLSGDGFLTNGRKVQLK